MCCLIALICAYASSLRAQAKPLEKYIRFLQTGLRGMDMCQAKLKKEYSQSNDLSCLHHTCQARLSLASQIGS
jgi:hypothetical protein